MNQSIPPSHVGIVMDGNGRWAKSKGLPRIKGHAAGVETAKRICLAAIQHNVHYLTLYSFSTENWKRSKEEVGYLMELFSGRLRKEYPFFEQNDISVAHIGSLSETPKKVQTEIKKVIDKSKNNKKLHLTFAINYGGQDDIIRAANLLLSQGHKTFTNELLESALDTAHIPPVDLIIRTGNRYRLSNFLLWHSAYAELYFSKHMWPEWTEVEFKTALDHYTKQNRTFGA